MKSEEINLEKFVDHYFTNKGINQQKNSKEQLSDRSRLGMFVQTTKNRYKDSIFKDKYEITQNDIDVLQLMNPRMSALQYMGNIVALYEKE